MNFKFTILKFEVQGIQIKIMNPNFKFQKFEIRETEIKILNSKCCSFLKKCKAKTVEENNTVIHFCAFIKFLYHEFGNLKFIEKTSVENFPFGRFSLIFRNTFVMLINVIFISKHTRSKFINILDRDLREINFVDDTKFIDLLYNLDLTTPSVFSSIEKITKSFFYRSNRRNLYGFFTQSKPNDKEKKIIQLFHDTYGSLFNLIYKKEICLKLNIKFKNIVHNKFNFILEFLNNDEEMDFLCNFIHNDKYIVNTYSPLTPKEYKKMFSQFRKKLKDFSDFILSF